MTTFKASKSFKTCCPKCAVPPRCPHCGAAVKRKSARGETEMDSLQVSFFCSTLLILKKVGASFTPTYLNACKKED